MRTPFHTPSIRSAHHLSTHPFSTGKTRFHFADHFTPFTAFFTPFAVIDSPNCTLTSNFEV